jgi:hypothetical protein
MLFIVKAEHKNGYNIWVEFSNGDSGVINLEGVLWGPIFEPLKNLEQFKKFSISPVFRTIVWENGADIAPEALFKHLQKYVAV